MVPGLAPASRWGLLAGAVSPGVAAARTRSPQLVKPILGLSRADPPRGTGDLWAV